MDSLFDKIYCICMTERKSHMERFFKRFNLKTHIYIEPVLKTDLEMKYNVFDLINDGYIQEEFVVDKFNFGRLANALSFIKTLQKFLDSGASNCLILEDDIYIPKEKYITPLNNYLIDLYKHQLPSNWQYVNLGRCWAQNCDTDEYITHNVISNCEPVCTHAITVKRKIAHYLIDNTLPLKKPKDRTWNNIIFKNDDWKPYAYCVSPIVFKQDRATYGTSLDNRSTNQKQCANDSTSTNYYFMDEIREHFEITNDPDDPNAFYKMINCIVILILIIFCIGLLFFYIFKNQ